MNIIYNNYKKYKLLNKFLFGFDLGQLRQNIISYINKFKILTDFECYNHQQYMPPQ